MIQKKMHTVSEVSALIRARKKLLLAGDESLLRQLPPGDWIGGTIPYFMTEKGGSYSREHVFVTELPSFISEVNVTTYDERSIESVYLDAPEHGFSVIILPAGSGVHLSFALKAPRFRNFAARPLVGWIAGVFLEELRSARPRVFDGRLAQAFEQKAVVMQVRLPPEKMAEIGILNIFEPNPEEAIQFPQDGFTVRDAVVNGRAVNFAQYITEKEWDTKLPLVADYYGALINISFQSIDLQAKEVKLYAPVFRGVTYRQARPLANYVEQFCSQLPAGRAEQITFSCNCILNYLYSELEGKKTADITGPITFGEVAYQLLNQTMVYLTIHDAVDRH